MPQDKKVILLDTHRIYSDKEHRFRIAKDQTAVQTLPTGTGGGTLPYIIVKKEKHG